MSHYLTTLLKNLHARHDDDIVDRINYHYTSSLIVIFSILVSAKQYVGYPIQCWVPAHFTDAMEQYTENYCWVQNTWFLPIEAVVPQSYYQRDEKQLIYYQWVPFILLLQAICFYIPCFAWRLLYWQAGLDINIIGEMAYEAKAAVENELRAKTIATIAVYVEDALSPDDPDAVDAPVANHSGYSTLPVKADLEGPLESKTWKDPAGAKIPCPSLLVKLLGCASKYDVTHCGVYVSVAYLFVKLLYAGNLLLQFTLLHYLLDTESTWFGLELVRDLAAGRDWFQTGFFPRVTYCDFQVKVMGNIHRHTVQCVLMINMFNEKIFLFLWFWFAALLIATLLSALVWLLRILPTRRRRRFVRTKLKGVWSRMTHKERQLFRTFEEDFLRCDGILLLYMMAGQTGTVVLNEVTGILWTWYRNDRLKQTRPPFSPSKLDLSPESSDRETTIDFLAQGISALSGRQSDVSSFREYPSGPEAVPPHPFDAPPASLARKKWSRAGRLSRESATTTDERSHSQGQRKRSSVDEAERALRLENMERSIMIGDRDERRAGLREGRRPAKEAKAASKSLFKSDNVVKQQLDDAEDLEEVACAAINKRDKAELKRQLLNLQEPGCIDGEEIEQIV